MNSQIEITREYVDFLQEFLKSHEIKTEDSLEKRRCHLKDL